MPTPGYRWYPFKGKAPDGDAFVPHGVKESFHNIGRKSLLLPVVHLNHLIPVGRDLGQSKVLAEVSQVKNVFLETGTTPAVRHLFP